LHNEEHHDLYSSPDIKRMMKSRRMRLARHGAHIGGRKRILTEFRWKNLKE
jgi:hypothetical protein